MASELTIALRGDPLVFEDGTATEAITPGHLVSGVGSVIKHAVAGGAARRLFALENDVMGKGINDAYAINDVVKVGAFAPGMRVNAWLATGQTIAAGDALESDGLGQVRSGAGTTIGYAVEAVTTTSTALRIAIEVY